MSRFRATPTLFLLCLTCYLGGTLPGQTRSTLDTSAAGKQFVAGRRLDGWKGDLQSADTTVRLRAAKSIGIFGPPAIATLTEMLSHDDASVRYWSASHLGNLGPQAERVLPSLRALTSDSSQGVRMAVAYALFSVSGGDSSLDELTAGLNSGVRGTACCAAEFLGRLGPAAIQSLPSLVEAFQKHSDRAAGGDYHVRGSAQNAIRKVQDESPVFPPLQVPTGGTLRDWNGNRDPGPPRDTSPSATGRPNILWISCEDISPNLGCYGDAYASTPNLDQLARQGARFTNAFTPAGVCAVVRSGVITGVYPISLGSQHMRSRIVPAPEVRCFTEYLRAAGYFCTNKSKTDYQFEPPLTAWDRQGTAHRDWRECPAGRPFFSVVNITISHESQIRHSQQVHDQLLDGLADAQHHDPDAASAFLPPIYPDTPATRKDWAWYHDIISEMDRQVGVLLSMLEEDGLADNTVVIFWSDHGRGLPRGKRWIYDSGVHIPMIVRWPGKIRPATIREDLVSTQDLAQTVLSIADVERPSIMQGRVFLGNERQNEPEYIYFHRDRMDEAYELMRGCRSKTFKYIRNYEPEKPYAQHIDYMDLMPTLYDMRRLNAAGRLRGPQRVFFRQGKQVEELYDIVNDPHETRNLAGQAEFRDTKRAMRAAVRKWQTQIGDQGLIPEPIMMQRMRPEGKYVATEPPTIRIQGSRATLTCATPGSSIAYQTDDSGQHWQLYSGAINVASISTLRAIAVRIGYEDSPIVTQLVP